jgi:hypothetical protein
MTVMPVKLLWLLIIAYALIMVSLMVSTHQARSVPLDLSGYANENGAISILHNGNTVDPYFALQALLLAAENNLDVARYAEPFANWLVERQNADGTFERYCRNGDAWRACNAADADDSLLALWLKFLESMPHLFLKHPRWLISYQRSQHALAGLRDPETGLYLVSANYQQSLLMDNVEVWWRLVSRTDILVDNGAPQLAQAVITHLWDKDQQRLRVSTQPENGPAQQKFYPEHVAQIFPLLFDFPIPALPKPQYYAGWIKQHRAEWLLQVHTDFAWGLIAVLSWRMNDIESTQCWLREASAFRHSSHWTVTDEVAFQILTVHGNSAASPEYQCG